MGSFGNFLFLWQFGTWNGVGGCIEAENAGIETGEEFASGNGFLFFNSDLAGLGRIDRV